MNGLYQIPGVSFTALCHAVVIYFMSEHKYSQKKYLFYGLLYVICFVGIGSFGFGKGVAAVLGAYIGIVICTFAFSCIVSRDCFAEKCFLFISYFCLFSVVDNGMKLIIQLSFPRISDLAEYYAAVILRNAVLLLLLVLYKKYAAETLRSLSDISSRRWWNLGLIALLFYLMQTTVSFVNVMTTIPSAVLLFMFAAVSVVMCAVYAVVFSNISYMKKVAEAALIGQNAEYLSARLSALQDAEERHRRLRHDMRHHLETIAEYAKEGDTDDILAYIREYSIEVSETAAKQYSVNRTMNNILSVYGDKAQESGIAFTTRCNAPAEMAVRDIDLIAILGNLLENALHGCLESQKEQPCIQVHIRLQKSILIIVCDNTCPEALKLSEGLPAEKGIGISSILTTCRKYDGSLDYKVENGICSACVVLNL